MIIRFIMESHTLNWPRLEVNKIKDFGIRCKLLILGGGSGGITMAAKFSRRLKTKGSIILIEPCQDHYYQPLFTLVGGGVFSVRDTLRREADVMPKGVKWIRDYAVCIDPDRSCVGTKEGHVINYEYLIVAVGVIMNYAKTPGLLEALQDPNSCVSTIFTYNYCGKTWSDLQKFKGGEAIFTYPKSYVKCPGAPQKIAYLADSYFAKTNVRSKTNITYSTCTPCIFGIKKYCEALDKVAERKKIHVDLQVILKEIHHDKKEAVFHKCADPDHVSLLTPGGATCTSDSFVIIQLGDDIGSFAWGIDDHELRFSVFRPAHALTETRRYDLLHVTPHQHAPDVIRLNKQIVDDHGFLHVDMYTLQHVKYPNIYGIGDCMSAPNSKTAAAIAKQSYVVERNLLATMQKDCPKEKYNGYGACPLITSYNTVILAEFVYGGIPHETMPFDQAKESVIAFYMKKHLFPFLYWNLMLKGYYHGPEFVRRIINPFGW